MDNPDRYDLTDLLALAPIENAAPAGPRNGAKTQQEVILTAKNTQPDHVSQDSALDVPLSLSIFPDVQANSVRKSRMSLRGLADIIRQTNAARKSALPLLKLARFGDILTPKGSLRHDANLESVSGVEGDYDAGLVPMGTAADLLRRAGIAAVFYTSTHHAPDTPRWRVLCPLSAEVTREQRGDLCARLNGALGGILGDESFKPSQSYYFGAAALRDEKKGGGAAHPLELLLIDGRHLDLVEGLEAVAARAPIAGNKAAKDESRSGRAFRVAGECKRAGMSRDQFRDHLLNDADLADWASDARQVDRAWQRAGGGIHVDADDFDDLPELVDTINGFPMTEDGVARAFAAAHADRLRFCHSSGRWHVWTGTHWRKEETKLAFNWSREICRARSASDPLSSAAKALAKAATAAAVERFAQADRAFAVTATAWDTDHWLLGTPGGTVDLRTGQLREARQTEMITKVTAAAPIPLDDFDASRDCPRWMAFLDQATGGDLEAIRFLQQWFGYSLTGDTREEALLFVHGIGGSGKSTAINTVAALLGDYATAVDTETITAQKHARHSTEIARLHGARMAYASETEAGRAWAENRIKQLTGGDVMTARFMRQDDFSFKPQLKLVIVGNNKPAFSNVDGAIKRRFNVMPFDRKPTAPDHGLKAALEAEFPGILAWAVLGCLDWQRDGLKRPAVMIETTEEYFAEQDTFANWLADKCETGTCPDTGNTFAATTEDLFESWSWYARQNGDEPGNKRGDFPQRMRERGFEPVNRTAGLRGRGWKGLRLQRHADAFDDLPASVEGGEKWLTH